MVVALNGALTARPRGTTFGLSVTVCTNSSDPQTGLGTTRHILKGCVFFTRIRPSGRGASCTIRFRAVLLSSIKALVCHMVHDFPLLKCFVFYIPFRRLWNEDYGAVSEGASRPGAEAGTEAASCLSM